MIRSGDVNANGGLCMITTQGRAHIILLIEWCRLIRPKAWRASGRTYVSAYGTRSTVPGPCIPVACRIWFAALQFPPFVHITLHYPSLQLLTIVAVDRLAKPCAVWKVHQKREWNVTKTSQDWHTSKSTNFCWLSCFIWFVLKVTHNVFSDSERRQNSAWFFKLVQPVLSHYVLLRSNCSRVTHLLLRVKERESGERKEKGE
jgi:hypothetical protein